MKFQFERVRANTLMGQHFLRDRRVLSRVVEAARITRKDSVLEVGPGTGVLTEELASRAKKVIAVEKDVRLANILQERFADCKNVEIILGDILKIDLTKILPSRYIIVANLPYYLTSKFLRLFLDQPLKISRPRSVTLMVQYEVACRIVAQPPQMNLLALSVQAFGEPSIVKKIPRAVFRPVPRVDSAIIHIENIGDSFFKKNKMNKKLFFALARRAFSQKRKTLKNSIGIDSAKRPQELSLDDWSGILGCRAAKYATRRTRR